MADLSKGDKRIRQPIVSVLGHVDHGKTTFLDYIRGTNIVSREAGRITQHIGATEVPLEAIREICGPLMEGKDFKVPGLLFIDTPGHSAFTSLRKRGSTLAEIAVLVIDINEGLMPQGKESIEILRHFKTPFIIFANKIDRINGWDIPEEARGEAFLVNARRQDDSVLSVLDSKIYDLIGQIYREGKFDDNFSAERYDRIKDFTSSIAIVPGSALYGVGIADALLILVGLAQRYLEERITSTVRAGYGKATVLEVKDEKGLGKTIDVIVYDGTVRQGDHMLIPTVEGDVIHTKIRALLKPKPLDEIRDPRNRFDSVPEVEAAAGIKIAAPDLDNVVAGMPIVTTSDTSLLPNIEKDLKKEVEIEIPLETEGLYVKADTIGSLEGLTKELQILGVPIRGYGIGAITKRDVIETATFTDPIKRVILGFNVRVLPEAEEQADISEVTILTDNVIYQLVDKYQKWLADMRSERERDIRKEVTHPGKIKILPDYVFRIKDPAIVGVRVLAGRIRPHQALINEDGRIVGRIRSIQKDKESITEAMAGDEVAVSISSAVVGRSIHKDEILYVDLPEGDAKRLFTELKDTLNEDELEVLNDVARIKRRIHNFWAM